MSTEVSFSSTELQNSAKKYRKELLAMPVIALEQSIQHMTVRTGIRGEETVGELDGDMQIGPYSESREDTNSVGINPRTLTTFKGSVMKKFSPNSVANSIYGAAVLSGEGLKSADIVFMVVAYLAKRVSKALNKNLWTAVRDASGTTTADLFNGFDTITAAEITANKITTALGNLHEFEAAISSSNAVDKLKEMYRAGSDELQEEMCKMFITKDIYNAYCDDYQASNGSLPYNKEFNKTFLEGSNNMCELVPLANKKGTKYIHLTTQGNMLVGVDQMSDEEKVLVEKYHPLVLTFVMVMYFGTQFESISKERFLVGKLYVAPQG